jgi:hypothetical protein
MGAPPTISSYAYVLVSKLCLPSLGDWNVSFYGLEGGLPVRRLRVAVEILLFSGIFQE